MPNVTHQPDSHRFVIDLENGDEGLLQYKLSDGKIVFTHTEVPPHHEGQGIGSKLAEAGLNYARENKLSVVPRCPFIADYVQSHPEYKDIVDPQYW
jgi:hypothetical protein